MFTAPGQHQGLLSAAKPGGTYFSTVLLLEVFITSTTFQIRPGIGNCEPFMEADSQQGWVFPAADVATSSGAWSTTPWPLNAQVGWSLTPGAEYLVFACSQHRFTNRSAVPLLIARDQVSGHWILAASPPSTSNGLRAVSWNVRSGQPSGSRTRWREPTSTTVQIRRPAELVIATTDWSDYESANEPAQFWEPLILPSDFAAVNLWQLRRRWEWCSGQADHRAALASWGMTPALFAPGRDPDGNGTLLSVSARLIVSPTDAQSRAIEGGLARGLLENPPL